jgi:hypothetical protein
VADARLVEAPDDQLGDGGHGARPSRRSRASGSRRATAAS